MTIPESIRTVASSEGVADLLREGRTVRVRVQGRSMAPLIPDGAVVTLEPVPAETLRAGDIAFYSTPGGRLVCHRLLARRRVTGGFLLGFRGDAFADPLEWISATGVMGKVTHCDGQHLDCPHKRWVGWTQAWLRWLVARSRIRLGAWRRQLARR